MTRLPAVQEARDGAEWERGALRAQRALLDEALEQLGSGRPQLEQFLSRCQAAELEVSCGPRAHVLVYTGTAVCLWSQR